MTSLEDALERSHQMIDEAPVETRAELETANAGARKLLDQIAPTEAILGDRPPSPTADAQPGCARGASRHET